ncbi:hypothetical protein [Arthrobacter cheniae]|uniref:hypothetical protein n=1 Tax=Arthrobacter cheniae TaxID=1258888 RepID=UPI0015FF475D|nr:hypothetical protein [Arthrobacter cheniae]
MAVLRFRVSFTIGGVLVVELPLNATVKDLDVDVVEGGEILREGLCRAEPAIDNDPQKLNVGWWR